MKLSTPGSLLLEGYFEPLPGRALRSTLSLVLPLIWGLWTRHMDAAVLTGVSAQLLINAPFAAARGFGCALSRFRASSAACWPLPGCWQATGSG